MKTLVIVHIEPIFEEGAGPLNELVNKVVEFASGFDRVINVTCEGKMTWIDKAGFPQLEKFEQQEWIWGYWPANYPDAVEGVDYISTKGHCFSEICPWMQSLPKESSYTLVGGFRSQCLQDVYNIFEHLDLNPVIEEELTYGSYKV